jgi:para-nitrobenzyl esterase
VRAQFIPRRPIRAAATKVGTAVAALAVVASTAAGANAGTIQKATSTADPVVSIEGGTVRGAAGSGIYSFRGLPYAAAPTGDLRWRPPAPPVAWPGVRDATEYGANCAQPDSPPFSVASAAEDCLFLNVTTPSLRSGAKLPVLAWIHGGGWTGGAGRDFDGTKLAQTGVVVVTINYRLGALGYLTHPALAATPGGASGNYGQMDQQAALRWVQSNIRRFGGDPANVTIAGESAGALSVIGHLISDGSRGLFHRAIIQSGSFARNQLSRAQGESFGQAFAAKVDCPDQTASCLRNVPVSKLLANFPPVAIPGVVDGEVFKESFGSALAAGRFARVPVINGVNQDEQLVFVVIGLTVRETYIPIPTGPNSITAENYESNIAAVLDVSPSRAAEIAARYPVDAYPLPLVAFSTLNNDASWACPALQMNQWFAKRVPTFAYEFNDSNAPARYFPQFGLATHTNELPYIFDLPDAPIQQPFSADSAELAADMRDAWASFAGTGDPGLRSDFRWPSFGGADQQRVISLDTAGSAIFRDFGSRHNCDFWSGG